MSARFKLEASFTGGDTTGILRAIQYEGWYPEGKPDRLDVDHRKHDGKLTIEAALARAKQDVYARFEEPDRVLRVAPGRRVEIQSEERDVDMQRVVEVLETVPFELGVFSSRYGIAWEHPTTGSAYLATSMPGHLPLGWGFACRGRGYHHLVSPRWLETGPWKLWRGADDLRLIQFHALDVDADTGREQAIPGHAQIGNFHDESGYLQDDFVYECKLEGLYDSITHTMKVVILGREIPDRELREWAARRRDSTQPIKRVAFVFMQEAEARANLFRIWRYGHECWAIREGVEVRLDLDFVPPDTTPAWART